MTAVVRNSVLNPLATCFIPSSLKTFNRDKTTLDIKSVPKESNMDESSNDPRTVERLTRPITDTDLEHIREKLLFGKRFGEKKKLKRKVRDSTTMVFFGFPSIIPENISNSMRNKRTLYAMSAFGICNLILLAVLKLLYNQGFGKNSLCRKPSKAAENKETKKEDEKCCCPPMFGWVLPPTFFGNPFNLKYECCKNYAHSSRYLEGDQMKIVDIQSMKQIDKWELCNISDEKETLKQCSLEFQMIIRDVCNSVRDNDTPSEWQEYFKLSGRKDELNDRRSSAWNTPEDKTSDESLVDDGTHPLLESLPSGNFITEDEEVHESTRAVEKILEICLPGKGSHPDKQVLTTAICNPPCSVWCDFLPSGAKDSFLRFLSKSQENMNNAEMLVGQKPVSGKPVYKRSFSADDAPNYANLCQGLSSLTSEVECRERLMLLRQGLVSQFGLNKREYGSSHPDLLHGQLKACLSTEGDSSMWGPFDSAESLWQPLPDCIPTSDCNQKQNFNRKGREIRRQRLAN